MHMSIKVYEPNSAKHLQITYSTKNCSYLGIVFFNPVFWVKSGIELLHFDETSPKCPLCLVGFIYIINCFTKYMNNIFQGPRLGNDMQEPMNLVYPLQSPLIQHHQLQLGRGTGRIKFVLMLKG